METTQSHFGNLPDGREVLRFTFRNSNGVEVSVMNFGAIITSVRAPDREGKMAEITLGFDSLDGYAAKHPFFGATVGRYANRIGGASFDLDGKHYPLAANNGPNHLHGGLVGFDKRVWEAVPFSRGSQAGVRMSYVSPDGEEGYPGRLAAHATFSLNERNELDLRWEASTDAPTIINMTNHSYWNLAGSGQGLILGNEVTLHCDAYLPVDAGQIPTGEINEVAGTPFDFRTPKLVSRDMAKAGGGYDHCWVIRQDAKSSVSGPGGRPLYAAARVFEPKSGRGLELFASQPGVQFYTGNNITSVRGRSGLEYTKHSGLCLETQAFPDAVHHANFPPVVLRPGEQYDEIAKLYFFAK
ncbi:MAG TPA: aldose epimerase family protein [Spirochaetia bacterium]|nr:aldose epimerase family protein [Spirochaetia bacterium]